MDDEPNALITLVDFLESEGFEVRQAADGLRALGQAAQWPFDILLTDLRMPAMDGMALTRKLRERNGGFSTVLMTAHGTIENAVEAIRDGVDEYMTKPILLDELRVTLNRVLAHRKLHREAERLREQLRQVSAQPNSDFLGGSDVFTDHVALIAQVATCAAPVLIWGENGSGKEMTARMVHSKSRYSEGPFVAVRCRAVAADAVEAEIFGSGSSSEHYLARARGGSLYLDEIESLRPAAQRRLVAYLRSQDETPTTTGSAPLPTVRILAGTDVDLFTSAEEGRFDRALLSRLASVTLHVPALRERKEDIPLLVAHFLDRYMRRDGRGEAALSDRTLGILLAHDWPGNLRELETSIERAVVLAQGREIEPHHLTEELGRADGVRDTVPSIPGASLSDVERYVILKTLETTGGSTGKAAKLLGISARKIQYRLNEYSQGRPE